MISYTRNDLANELATRMGCTTDNAKGVVEHFIAAISGALKEGKKIEFRGFGVLEVIRRKGKIGRNPKDPTSGVYQIPPRNVVKFRSGKDLDENLNREKSEAAVSA